MNAALRVGQGESVQRVFSQSDFDRFAALSGDINPIHVDAQFSARTKFGRPVAHGMYLYGVVCSVLGTRLPGPGTVQVEQELMFPNATYAGVEVEVRVDVAEVRLAEGVADLTTFVIHPDGNRGLQGRSLVRLPGVPFPSPPAADVPTPAPSPAFKGLEPGQRAGTRRAFSVADLTEYADLTGDTNPLFTDGAYARRQGLAGVMVPGALLGGLFSYLLGTELPGQGTNYLKQRLRFPIPAYAGQELKAFVEIVRIRPEKQLVNLSAICSNPAGDIVCYGESLVLVSDVEREA